MAPGLEDQAEGRQYGTLKSRELRAQHHRVKSGEALVFSGTAEREFGYKVQRANSVFGKCSTLLIPKPATAHDPQPVPSTSHPQSLFP